MVETGAAREVQVFKYHGRLLSAIEQAEMVFDELYGRLGPVLANMPERGPGAKTVEVKLTVIERPTCPLAIRLNELVEKVNTLISKIREVKEHLEV